MLLLKPAWPKVAAIVGCEAQGKATPGREANENPAGWDRGSREILEIVFELTDVGDSALLARVAMTAHIRHEHIETTNGEASRDCVHPVAA
jgi:hypothetical protein